jgi:hypothetical protein
VSKLAQCLVLGAWHGVRCHVRCHVWEGVSKLARCLVLGSWHGVRVVHACHVRSDFFCWAWLFFFFVILSLFLSSSQKGKWSSCPDTGRFSPPSQRRCSHSCIRSSGAACTSPCCPRRRLVLCCECVSVFVCARAYALLVGARGRGGLPTCGGFE